MKHASRAKPFLVVPHLPQIALMPRHSSMEMFIAGDSASNSRKQTYERYRCHEAAKGVTRPPMSDTCAKLIASMSAIINDGAMREWGGILIIAISFSSHSFCKLLFSISHSRLSLLLLLLQRATATHRAPSARCAMPVAASAAAGPT